VTSAEPTTETTGPGEPTAAEGTGATAPAAEGPAAGAEPTAAEPPDTDPTAAESAEVSAVTGPPAGETPEPAAAAEPVAAEPAAAEPAAAEPAAAEQAEPAAAEHADSDGSGAEDRDDTEGPDETGEPADESEPWRSPEPFEAAPAAVAAALTGDDAVRLAREVAEEMAGADTVGEHEEWVGEDANTVTHHFAAHQPGYRGWRWSITLACAGPDEPLTVSETALLPGPDALVAPTWVPWQERVRAGDLGVGDLLPCPADDARLSPAYVESDDPAIEDVAVEVGLGRTRVLSRPGRLDAADRWRGERGPGADMARSAPGSCALCGFYMPLAGSMSAAFGVCANEYGPADGAVVHAEYGCGAHSDVRVDPGPVAPVAEVVYDDGVELEHR
jgi:hypothetical protein